MSWILVVSIGCATGALRDEVRAAALPAGIVAVIEAADRAAPAAPWEAVSSGEPAKRTTDRRSGPTPSELLFVFAAIDTDLFERASRQDYVVPSGVTEAQALTIFLARNEQLRASWRAREGARHRHGQVLALSRLVSTYESFERRPDKPRPTPTPPTPDALRSRIVAADVALEGVAFEVKALELAQDLAVAFHGARFEARAAGIIGEGVSLAKRLVGVARARLTTGPGSTGDVLRAEMRRERLLREWRTAYERRDAARRKLGALLDTSASVKPGKSLAMPHRQGLEGVRALAASRSPDVRSAQLRAQRSEAMLALAESQLQPGWTLGTAERSDGVVRQPFRAADVTGGHYLEELRQRVAAAGRSLAQARTLMPAVAERAHADLGDALRRVSLFRNALGPRARQALKSVESEYRVGRAGWLELDDAQRLWLDTDLGYQRAARDAHVAAAALRRLLGGTPDSKRSTP